MFKVLTEEQALEVKNRIWNGERYASIGVAFSISLSTVAAITKGRAYYEIEWPGGTIGPMPRWRQMEIHRARSNKHRAAAIGERIVKDSPLVDMLRERQAEEDEREIGRLIDQVKDVD